MSPVQTVGQVFDSIQKVKAGASSFCTNFFPVQAKIEAWIDRGELFSELRDGAAFFVRTDRDFGHLYFCAAARGSLERELPGLQSPGARRLTTDVVGREADLASMLSCVEGAGFRRYSRLVRLTRPNPLPEVGKVSEPDPAKVSPDISFAEPTDAGAILSLLEALFDPLADQLPTLYEIEDAIRARQILLIKREGELAAFLHFETQGMMSTIRYWVVARAFQSQRLGGTLIRHYLESHTAVRRFILWVTATNDNAVQKYHHYRYAPDGLVDHVLIK
jgi:hypothetical protein